MFTGIVQEVGTIRSMEHITEDTLRLEITSTIAAADAARGDSIAVNGVCLTVTDQSIDSFWADVMVQTLNLTSLGTKKIGDTVNLEPAMLMTTRLGGHIVQGHVEEALPVLEVSAADDTAYTIRIRLNPQLAPLLINQGSITVDGVSLTVSAVSEANSEDQWFEVSLIPETLQATTLGALKPSDLVNIETDLLARHVARILQFQTSAATV